MKTLFEFLFIGALGLSVGLLINLWLDLQVVDLACTYSLSPADLSIEQKD